MCVSMFRYKCVISRVCKGVLYVLLVIYILSHVYTHTHTYSYYVFMCV